MQSPPSECPTAVTFFVGYRESAFWTAAITPGADLSDSAKKNSFSAVHGTNLPAMRPSKALVHKDRWVDAGEQCGVQVNLDDVQVNEDWQPVMGWDEITRQGYKNGKGHNFEASVP